MNIGTLSIPSSNKNRLTKLFERTKILAIISNNIMLWRDTAFILAIIINLMVLIAFKRVDDPDNPETDDHDKIHIGGLQSAINTLGILLIIFSMIIVAYFLLKTAPLLVAKAWVGVVYPDIF